MIYTSGSTGMPKGVMVEHEQVTRLFRVTESSYGFNDQDVWCLFHSLAFDFSVWELWGALAYGGRLVIVPRDVVRSSRDFYRWWCDDGSDGVEPDAERIQGVYRGGGRREVRASFAICDLRGRSAGAVYSEAVVQPASGAEIRSW